VAIKFKSNRKAIGGEAAYKTGPLQFLCLSTTHTASRETVSRECTCGGGFKTRLGAHGDPKTIQKQVPQSRSHLQLMKTSGDQVHESRFVWKDTDTTKTRGTIASSNRRAEGRTQKRERKRRQNICFGRHKEQDRVQILIYGVNALLVERLSGLIDAQAPGLQIH